MGAYQKAEEIQKESTDKFIADLRASREETERRRRYEEAMIELAERSREAKTSEAESTEDRRGPIDALKKVNERDLTRWFRETWIKEGRPKGSDFFNKLKSYVNKPGSPIIEHYTYGKDGPGIRLITGSGKIQRTKKAIQNMASNFKKE